VKFLVDAHLPRGLCAVLQAAGHEVIHTHELPAGNETQDEIINDLSFRQQRVVITKDSDFYHSHLLHRKPWKLVLVRTGNIRNRELIELFVRHLELIIRALAESSLIELDRRTVQIVV
jgi:predicted nuclease of predicted toxin-antitoxin system